MHRDRVIFHSSESMKEIKSGSARLVVISPPLSNNGRSDEFEKSEYLTFIRRVLIEVDRVLCPSGVVVSVNTDLRDHACYNGGDQRFEGLIWFKHADIRAQAEMTGFKCIDHKIWVKSTNVNVYRYNFAHIMFFCKEKRKPFRPGSLKHNRDFRSDVWLLPGGTQRADTTGYRFRSAIHPAIAERCIQEFTRRGELVVSPFTGSGTILAVANLMGRRWIGYEIDRRLKRLIMESIHGPDRPKVYDHIIERVPVT